MRFFGKILGEVLDVSELVPGRVERESEGVICHGATVTSATTAGGHGGHGG